MDQEFAERISFGSRILVPGAVYSVVRGFSDDQGSFHGPSEQWRFLGFTHPKMYPGYVLFVSNRQGEESQFRLRWGSGGQDELIAAFDQYVAGPPVSINDIVAAISDRCREELERCHHWFEPEAQTAEELIRRIERAHGYASTAAGRSYAGSGYEDIASDLEIVARVAIGPTTRPRQAPVSLHDSRSGERRIAAG